MEGTRSVTGGAGMTSDLPGRVKKKGGMDEAYDLHDSSAKGIRISCCVRP